MKLELELKLKLGWFGSPGHNSYYQGSQFLIACHETALASVYSNYYWSQGQQAGICMPIFRAIWHVFRYVKKGIQSMVLSVCSFELFGGNQTFCSFQNNLFWHSRYHLTTFSRRYHLGSVAFGSFIITLVKIPQIIIGYIYYKTKNTQSEVGTWPWMGYQYGKWRGPVKDCRCGHCRKKNVSPYLRKYRERLL